MSDLVAAAIRRELSRIEAEEQVTVLYACESGSRAWGFASTDSDYDVRFIYLRPTPWYLSIQKRRDVIERPLADDLDIAGWDLPKALGLLRKSNPPLFEWLQSPIVYREWPGFLERLRPLLSTYYSPVSCMHHYLSMARGNVRQYLTGEQVWVKKYFYVLRPLLACLWIERGYGPVPMEFAKLVERVVEDTLVRARIDALVEAKREGEELDSGPREPAISGFIEAQMARLEAVTQAAAETPDPACLDRLWHELLVAVDGPQPFGHPGGRAL